MNKNLAELLKLKNITQKELAENVGATQAMISYIVKGYKTPSVPLLKRIADYLGVSMDDLVTTEEGVING